MTKGQPSGLLGILLDREAEIGDRQDAAMDLGAFDEARVEEALARLACDPATDDDLADACGESLAEIWCRKGDVTRDILTSLTPVSLRIAMGTMQALEPQVAAKAIATLAMGKTADN